MRQCYQKNTAETHADTRKHTENMHMYTYIYIYIYIHIQYSFVNNCADRFWSIFSDVTTARRSFSNTHNLAGSTLTRGRQCMLERWPLFNSNVTTSGVASLSSSMGKRRVVCTPLSMALPGDFESFHLFDRERFFDADPVTKCFVGFHHFSPEGT